MKRKQRFIVSFENDSKEDFLSTSSKAKDGITGNPDFEAAPVKPDDFTKAYDVMVVAAPDAVRSNIDGLRIFKPLRQKVEGMMTQLGNYAQDKIGNDPDRMKASGLPLTKMPVARPSDINEEVKGPKLELGDTAGKIKVTVKPNPAAEGIVIEERLPDLTYKEIKKTTGFKATTNGYNADEVVVVQLRYWNNDGVGPRMGRPLAIVV
jgi:hypothetical protein